MNFNSFFGAGPTEEQKLKIRQLKEKNDNTDWTQNAKINALKTKFNSFFSNCIKHSFGYSTLDNDTIYLYVYRSKEDNYPDVKFELEYLDVLLSFLMLNLIDCKDYSNFQNIYTYINKLNSLDNYALLVTPFYNNSYLSKWIKEKKQTSSMTYTNFLLTRCIPPELKTNLFSQKLNMTEDNFYKYIELTDKDTFVELVINTNETQQVIKDNSHIIVYNSNNKYVFSLSEFKCFIDFLNKNKYSIKTNKFVQFSDLITKHKNIKVCSVPNELLNRKSFIENGKETKIVNSTTFLQNMGLLIKEYFECCDKPSVFTLSCDAITPLLKSNEKQFKNNFLGLGGEEDSLNDDLKYKEKYLKYKQKYLLLKNKL